MYKRQSLWCLVDVRIVSEGKVWEKLTSRVGNLSNTYRRVTGEIQVKHIRDSGVRIIKKNHYPVSYTHLDVYKRQFMKWDSPMTGLF